MKACDTCRSRKQRCDEQRPKCGTCQKFKLECNYREPQPTKWVTIAYSSQIWVMYMLLTPDFQEGSHSHRDPRRHQEARGQTGPFQPAPGEAAETPPSPAAADKFAPFISCTLPATGRWGGSKVECRTHAERHWHNRRFPRSWSYVSPCAGLYRYLDAHCSGSVETQFGQ